MDRQQKLQYQHRIEQYLSNEHVYDLFEELLKNLIVKQPDDPISYLIERLSSPPTKKIFIVGPPGFKVREFALQVADHYKFTTISVGDLLKKEVSKKLELGEEIESYFKNYSLVKDEIVINIVKKEIETIQKEKKSFILSGFPRTRAQGLAMQRAGIFPDAFIILNMDQDRILSCCEEKFKTFEKIMDKNIINNKSKHITNHSEEYCLNIRQIKQIYANNYFQIDCSFGDREEILEDIARLLKFKIKTKRPKRPASILIVNGTKEQRSTVAKKLSKRYGFVFVCARGELGEQISKNTEVGRLALDCIKKKMLIDDAIMNGLIQSRLNKVDCQMQGFVLEGYPKTLGQVTALKDTYIQPSLILMLDSGNSNKEVIQDLNKRYQNLILKVSTTLTDQQIFQKVCFQLENN